MRKECGTDRHDTLHCNYNWGPTTKFDSPPIFLAIRYVQCTVEVIVSFCSYFHISVRIDGERYTEDQLHQLTERLRSYGSHWRLIGTYLGFTNGELDAIEDRTSLFIEAPLSWLREVLSQWLHWAPGDRRGSVGYATREALRSALQKAGLGIAAHTALPG